MSDKTVFTKYHAKIIAEIDAIVYELSVTDSDENFLDYGYIIELGNIYLAFSKNWKFLGMETDKKDASLLLLHDWERSNV